MNSGNNHRYDDIIHLPHHTSATRPRMPMIDRAAQFSPFAALTGFGAAIRESGRLTDRRLDLDENRIAVLNEKIQLVLERLDERPEITVTYFEPDARKSGGAYISVTGRVKKVDEYERAFVLQDGTAIDFEQICEIESELFEPDDFW